MDDAGLVRRAQGGDPTAWAEIYDRYADRLHDHCWSILRDRHEAEDALHDAFITAAAKVHQLRDPERLRPWLYAICRTASLTRTRRRARQVPTEDPAVVSDLAVEDAEPDEGELAAIVWEAAEGLAPRDRAVLDLHLRQGLVGQDLGEALGVSAHHAAVLLGRVRDLVDRSLGALLVGRAGRGDCPDLAALLDGWDGTLSPLIRKRVARHIDRCDTCGERRRRLVSPAALFGSAPVVAAPLGLRQRVLDDIAGLGPGPGPRGGRPSRRRALVGLAAGVAVLVVAVGVAVATASGGDRPFLVADAGGVEGSATTRRGPRPTATTDPTVAGPASSTPSSPASIGLDTGPPPTTGGSAPGATTTGVVAPGTGSPSPPSTGPSPTTAPTTTPTTVVDEAPQVTALSIDRTSIDFNGASCRSAVVSARIADEGPVSAVLTWRTAIGSVTEVPMVPSAGVHQARIGPVSSPGDGPVTWWVSATDATGKVVRTADRTVTVADIC